MNYTKRWHRVHIKITRKGKSVHSRDGYVEDARELRYRVSIQMDEQSIRRRPTTLVKQIEFCSSKNAENLRRTSLVFQRCPLRRKHEWLNGNKVCTPGMHDLISSFEVANSRPFDRETSTTTPRQGRVVRIKNATTEYAQNSRNDELNTRLG